ncbi:hypothetical protein [Shewanella kaireitica]|uniref:hypothetical protein n=1 Tax=Shewanella kaireitica TaxID=212021 RepID=UPI00200CFC43|nr:hypothetical protein [Shewanella kaireitica]MCL1093667.1 hypothetical protein [Shewanella kaireitica]
MSNEQSEEQTVMVIDDNGRTQLRVKSRVISNDKVKSRFRRRPSKALSFEVFGKEKVQA